MAGRVAGRVADAETGLPLEGAHVILSGTLRGTATDRAGRFRLDGLAPGAYTLYVSMLGFAPERRVLLLESAQRLDTLAVALHPVVVETAGPTVTAARDPAWYRRLEKFERLFLGETPNAARTTLVNPEVLRFEATWWGRLRAWASAPLVIENRALGYRVTYFLEAFESSGGTLRYDGEPHFEALSPADSAEAARWSAAREAAYRGSIRHFLRALLDERTRAEGFTLYRRNSLERPWTDPARFPMRDAHAWRPAPADTTGRLLAFHGYLEVEYGGEPESEAYLAWQFGPTGRAPGPQRSWLRLSDGPTLVDGKGEVVDPYGVTVYGYFAFERVADELPEEYGAAPLPDPP